MKDIYKPLFTPWHIGNVEIKNRIVLTSMGGTDLFGWMEKHHFDEEGAAFLLKAAENNAGLVLPGCQPVLNPVMGQWLYKNEKMYEDLAAWMPKFHATGAKLFVQLTAGFGRSFTVSRQFEKMYENPVVRQLTKPILDLDRITATASPSPNRWSDHLPSREMTVKEIRELIDGFAKSARLLQMAGVDGVEIHAVHEGYLLDQFTLPYVNHRTDAYGGTRENRYRFAVEIVKAIKKECGNDFPVSLRYSIISKTKGFREGALPGEEYTEAGRDMEESEWAAKYLQDAGYDMLNCDNGTHAAWYWSHPPIYMPENCNLADAEHIRQFVDIPVVCAGKMNPDAAAEAIAENKIDAAGFARPFLADTRWVTKLINDQEDDIRPCINCHNACFNMGKWNTSPEVQPDDFQISTCAVNPETMLKDVHYIKPAEHPQKIIIIGGGVGGMEAARVLKLRGHMPVIYEKTDHLGGTLVPASAESYKGRMRQLLAWYQKQMKDLGIEIHLSTEITDLSEFEGHQIIIATGSKPRVLRKVAGHEKMVEACEFLRGEKTVGDHPAVIGGGLTGCEIAYELCLEGKHPIIVEMMGDLIQQKVCLANSSYLREYFKLHDVPVYLNTALQEVGDGSIVCIKDGKRIELSCDSVISSAGYIPNPLAIEKEDRFHHIAKDNHIHTVGDCRSIGNLKTVIWRAYEVAMKL